GDERLRARRPGAVPRARPAGRDVSPDAQAGGSAPPRGAPRRGARHRSHEPLLRQVHRARRCAAAGALLPRAWGSRGAELPPPPVLPAPAAEWASAPGSALVDTRRRAGLRPPGAVRSLRLRAGGGGTFRRDLSPRGAPA